MDHNRLKANARYQGSALRQRSVGGISIAREKSRATAICCDCRDIKRFQDCAISALFENVDQTPIDLERENGLNSIASGISVEFGGGVDIISGRWVLAGGGSILLNKDLLFKDARNVLIGLEDLDTRKLKARRAQTIVLKRPC